MNRTKVILSIFLMLFLLLAGLVLPSFWKSQKKEVSGNKGREPAKETAETNSDTPMSPTASPILLIPSNVGFRN